MLKLLQNNKKTSHQYISTPILVETTLDKEAYHELNDAGFHVDENVEWQPQVLQTKRQQPQSRTRAPTRPPRRPPPIFESLDDRAPQQVKFRPASSIYSQPSPHLPIKYFPRESIYTDDIEISPPSSPEFEAAMNIGRFRSRGDENAVSPIDEEPGVPSKQAGLSIPVLRREKRRSEAAANIQSRRTASAKADAGVNGNGQRKGAPPKYDPYTGEPTMDEKGRPQQVKPSTFSGGDRPVHDRSDNLMGTRTSITANMPNNQTGSTTFADRIRRLREKNAAAATKTEERPAWKGASGRQALVVPPTQPADVKAFSVPRKNNNRSVTAPESKKFGGLEVDHDDETRFVPEPTEMHPALRDKYIDAQSFTSSPSSSSELSPSRTEIPNYSLTPDPISLSDLHDISVGVVERNFREALKESNLSKSNYANGQLPSKFSVTTYDPSTHHTTPRPSSDSNHWTPSDAPPLPNNDSSSPPNRAETTPIVNRRRPRIGSPDSTKSAVPARKPVPESVAAASMSSKLSNTKGKKDLPLTPAEQAAKSQDLCVVLQAQLDNLARRRANLEKSIHQMTELMPLDGMMGGIGGALAGGGNMRNLIVGTSNNSNANINSGLKRSRTVMAERFTEKRREEEKLKVEELKSELADVKNEEHQVGLRLHRAWKRRDEGAVYEPTGLWVRRITG